MRTRSRIPLRQLLFAIFFFTAFLSLVVFLFTYRRDERLYENITSRLFQEEMASNTLDMHYTIANPDNYGIHDYEATLPCYSADNRLAGQARRENLISALSLLHPEKLPREDGYTLNLLVKSLRSSLAMQEYFYFEEPLAPSSGMQSQLPILLAEYAFRSERDVTDYLKLLDQTDEYFASLLAFEQEKASRGCLMAASSLQKVIDQCDTILDKESLEKETHFLQSTFRERLAKLVADGILPLDKAKKYVVLNNRLLRTVMRPAYEALADGLCVLQEDSIPLSGLAAFEGGKEYYELLFLSETGSGQDIPNLEDALLDKISAESGEIAGLIRENPALSALNYESELAEVFPYQNASQMLSDLQQRMQGIFPAIESPEEDQPGSFAHLTVKPVSKSLEDYCAPAFYLTPPMDDFLNNVIYINEKNILSSLDLYTTLAHEGYPGHMYQTVFYHSLQDNSASFPVRELLWYGGYLEGWALYVEFFSFDCASQIFLERNRPDLAAAVQIEKHNRSLLLCLYTLLDILIHYENASQPQIANVLNSFGIDSPSAASAIYEYIVENPANYPKYYVGYLEILELKRMAKEKWQDAYTDYDFHSFFLKAGPSDFPSLQELLRNSAAPGESEKTGN